MKATIMIVDDDAEDRELLRKAIHAVSSDINVIEARDGQDALPMITTSTPDLLFLDINMPIVDGYATLAAIRQRIEYNHVLVIMYSTSRRPADMERCLQLGANKFVTKPTNLPGLQSIVDDAVILIQQNRIK